MFDLALFDSYREDNRREVKSARDGLPRSLWETYSAFANCSGGVIILGVKEHEDRSWQTSGLKDDAKLRKEFWDLVNNERKVSVNLLTDSDVQTYTLGQDVVMTITVPPASRAQKPVYINNDMFKGSFRRNWEGDYHCTPEEVREMVRDQTEQTMDMRILEDWPMEVLNPETVRAYRNMHRNWRPGHVWGMLEDTEYLRNIGAAAVSRIDGRMHPTAAGLMMFGNEYDIVREFPEYFLDYRETLDPTIRWTDRLQSSSGDWSGNLFDFYFRVYNKLVKDIKVPFALKGAERVDDTPVHKAIREALANCLVNYDVYVSRGVVIKKSVDALVFENPGTIRVGKMQMRQGGESDPRNKALMKMFNLINIGERAGSGVPDVFKTWADQGWEEPVIEERFGVASRTMLTLSLKENRRQKSATKIGDKNRRQRSAANRMSEKTRHHLERLLAYMENGQAYRTKELSEAVGLQVSRTRDLLKILVETGKIESLGDKKNRRYMKRDQGSTDPILKDEY